MIKNRHKNIPASYLILLKNNEVLLLRRFNTGYEDGNYSLIAGHVDPGESFTECIIREAKEEAGIIINKDDLKVVHVMQRKKNNEKYERLDVFFVTDKWNGSIKNIEKDKCDDLSWFKINNLPKNTIDYVNFAINCYIDRIQYSEFGWN